MRKIVYILFALLGVGGGLQSCDNGETYAEQREKERDAISAFLNRDVVIRLSDGEELIHVGKINTISEGEFYAQDSTTNLERNEYVVFENTGVYMQIVRKGAGEKMKNGQQKRIICRYTEFNILRDSVQTTNNSAYWQTNPDILECDGYLRYLYRFIQYVSERGRGDVSVLRFESSACGVAGSFNLYQYRSSNQCR